MASVLKTIFSVHFLEWKSEYYYSNFVEIRVQEPNERYIHNGLNESLAPNSTKDISFMMNIRVTPSEVATRSGQ